MTENQKKPPPCPLKEGECGDENGECGDGEAEETSPFSHTPLSRTSSMRGNVAIIRRRQDEGMIFG